MSPDYIPHIYPLPRGYLPECFKCESPPPFNRPEPQANSTLNSIEDLDEELNISAVTVKNSEENPKEDIPKDHPKQKKVKPAINITSGSPVNLDVRSEVYI